MKVTAARQASLPLLLLFFSSLVLPIVPSSSSSSASQVFCSPPSEHLLPFQALEPPVEKLKQTEANDFALLYKALFDDDGGRAEGVAFKEEFMLVANYDQGLEILNINDPQHPVKLSAIKTKGNALDVSIRGDFAYVSQSTAGVAVIDISDPTSPQIIANIDPGGLVREVDMYSSLLYIITDFNGFFLYDISNPYNPKKISSWDNGRLHRGISVLKKHICLSSWGVGLEILDLTFVENPALISIWNETDCYAKGVDTAIINERKFAFLACSLDGLKIINITIPQSPELVATVFTGLGEMVDVTVKDGIAYCANDNNGLLVVDVSDPTSPVILNNYDTNGRTRDIAIEGSLIGLADQSHGIKILDGKNLANIQLLSQFFDHGQATKVQLIDEYLYVADGSGGLEIFSTSEPTVLEKVGYYREEGMEVQDFYIKDELAFLAAYDKGLIVVNVSEKTSPQKIASYNSGINLRTLTLKGDLLFIGGLNDAIEVLNVSNPTELSKVGEYTFPTTYANIYSFTVMNSTLLVGSSYESLTLLNISDPNNLTFLDSYSIGGSTVFDVVAIGSLIYAVAGQSGLQLLNLTNNHFQFINSFDSPGSATDLALTTNYAFIADGSEGITIVNITSVTSFEQIGQISKYSCYGLFTHKQELFIGGRADGVIRFDFDSDGDSISDEEEEQRYGTDPLNPDTDGDQMPDGFEIIFDLNPLDPTDAAEDPDEDGLTNLEEYLLIVVYQSYTNPFNPDTDADQLPDGYEIDYHFNPFIDDAENDPDFDHLTNLEEYFIGTNPRKKDTDGDGASDGLEVLFHTDPFDPKDNPARRQLIRIFITLGLVIIFAVIGVLFLVKYLRRRVRRNIEREQKILEGEEELLLF